MSLSGRPVTGCGGILPCARLGIGGPAPPALLSAIGYSQPRGDPPAAQADF